MMKNILLLVAKPRIGKSTCIKKIVNLLGESNCTGFYTEEIRDETTGERTGFLTKTLSGEETLLASTSFDSKLKIGKYGVHIEEFEKIGLPSLKSVFHNDRTLIIDEIGPMQMCSKRFREILLKLQKTEKIIIGTICFKGCDFIEDYKKMPNVDLIELTLENRDIMPNKVMELINYLKDYHTRIERKKVKAQKYIHELERFSLDELKITLNSEHGVRKIEYRKDKKFSCTCDFCKEFATCSHIMAVESLIYQLKDRSE